MEDLERLAARMVGIGFDGTTMPAEARELIRRGVGSVIFFARNFQSAAQFRALTAEVKSAGADAGHAVITCIDQEGGRVQRLRDAPFTRLPSMRDVGLAGDAQLAHELGRVIARELRAVNIDVNLAPVMDVDTNQGNPVISSRSFGPSSEVVARLGTALIRGMQDSGVGTCAKHFPGHGDTDKDSHQDLPRLPGHDLDRLTRVELVPFAAAIEAGVAAVMTAHVIYGGVDPRYPATLSSAVIDGTLRDRMRFGGLVMSDDMQMQAIADHYGFDEAIVLGANAGIDLFWVCHSHELQSRAIDVLARAAASGEIPRERLTKASQRLDAVVSRYVRPPVREGWEQVLGAAEHRAVVARIEALAGAASSADAEDPTERFLRRQGT